MGKIGLIVLASLASLNLRIGAWAASKPEIARWYGNRKAAVSLRFDDSLSSHVEYVIPTLNKYGIKATFMINPGTRRYRKHRKFWETQVPRMGHDLGDHTMHHSGADSVEEADYEIGEVSRLIWRLYPNRSKLMVFASGGGAKWGGENWEKLPPESGYKKLVEKYCLIDLYDGKHPAYSMHSSISANTACNAVDKTIREGGHLPFLFHAIGNPGFLDRLKALFHGYQLVTSRSTFQGIIQCITDREPELWAAPVLDVLKYEAEHSGSRLKIISRKKDEDRLFLSVATNPALYDHDLTLLVPNEGKRPVRSVFQVGGRTGKFLEEGHVVLVDVQPINSEIVIRYR
ncbi:MAG: hypothetical protein Kow00128_11890 [Deltaproteobacteria bacterium]